MRVEYQVAASRKSAAAANTRRQRPAYRPSPNVRDNVLYARDPELVVSGPAGTGKSRGVMEKIYLSLARYPGSRWLMFRKVRASLNKTGLVTWENHVIPPQLGIALHSKLDCYPFPNGSVLDLAGMDNPEKIKSGEWDGAYGQEITECDEADWELVGSRLRGGIMPYQMLIGDCNPGPPNHWVKVRCEQGARNAETGEERPRARMVETTHRDNPKLWDPDAQQWTEYGAKYLDRLRGLTGVRRLRLYKGIWAAAEGLVFDLWDEDLHTCEPFAVPYDWPCYMSVDFGFTAPFCWQVWRHDEEDDCLYLTHEIYLSHCLVEDHARMIVETMIDGRGPAEPAEWRRPIPSPTMFVADHDAEDLATLRSHLGFNVVPAFKAVEPGLQKVQERMRPRAGKGPRIKLFRRARVNQPDQFLRDRKKPTCTQEEVTSYVWDSPRRSEVARTASEVRRAELPMKMDDHGMDPMRYVVAQIDLVGVSQGVWF